MPLEVPAHAELVLEGLLDAADTVEEGRVSEFHGMYEAYGRAATATFTCLTRRDDAVLQVVEPGHHPEHVLLGAVAIAAGLEQALREVVPAVARVHVTDGGCGRTAVVVALGPHAPGDARRRDRRLLRARQPGQAGDGGRRRRRRRPTPTPSPGRSPRACGPSATSSSVPASVPTAPSRSRSTAP